MFKFCKIFLAVFIAASAFAQDVIVLRDGGEIQALVVEVGFDDIKYKRWHFQEGPFFHIEISKVFFIRHRNGDKDVFEIKEKQSVSQAAAESAAPAPQMITVKQPPKDADYEKRQKRIVKFTSELGKIENALADIKSSAPATYEVAKLSVDLLKLLNRAQEKKTFDFNELLPLIIKATLMSLPPQATTPLKTNSELAIKTFSFLTVDFKMPKDKATGVISSALQSWSGKSVISIKDEMMSVPPAHKLKVAMLMKYSIGVFATVIPQLNVTVKASL